MQNMHSCELENFVGSLCLNSHLHLIKMLIAFLIILVYHSTAFIRSYSKALSVVCHLAGPNCNLGTVLFSSSIL